MEAPRPSYPGARWWRFDFHTHTPASSDTPAWQAAIATQDAVTPQKWLLKFMAAGIDGVVVTDHNSGAWIDKLKEAYRGLKAEADREESPPGFRELTLFPGVEISVQGGVQILAVLDPSATTSDVDTLLGRVGYRGTKGHSDGVTDDGLDQVIRKILAAGAIPIPAHADLPKGLLECSAGAQSKVDPTTLRQAVEVEGLLAVEWCNPASHPPQCVTAQAERLARVLGSDCHSFQGTPGTRYTWAKMAAPTLEGLRLALLDGNGVSVRRSDEGAFDPNRVPAHALAAIEIANSRYMGNGKPARIALSPFFNAVVGGRGTGKSTVVHALRLVAGRSAELAEGSEPWAQFDAFRKIPKGRSAEGALRETTDIKLEWRHDDALLRLVWRAGGPTSAVEEWRDGEWRATGSQAVNAARFPLRILSQGQIADIAGEGRRALLAIIDESAGVDPQRAALDEATRTFKAQRAKLRELDGKLAERPEVERKLGEAARKLAAFATNDHAAILRGYARANSQLREIKATLDQADESASRIEELSGQLELDDWSEQQFAEREADLHAWRADVDAAMEGVRRRLQAEAEALRMAVADWKQDARLQAWKSRHTAAKDAHTALQEQLAASGVQDPGAFERLTRERQSLDQREKDLTRVTADRQALLAAIDTQRQLIKQRREAITAARQGFLAKVLRNNPHVQIKIAPHGFDPRQIERELRELLDANDDRFANDILSSEGDEDRGMASDLADAADKRAAIDVVRERLLNGDPSFHGHFKNHLSRKNREPEFADRVLLWSPEDDLRIEYQREGRWIPIDQGSQGQRSAALLAFLLAFGEEPIVLDQPEDDLDNHLIYDLIVRQIRENKLRRQLVIVTHNPNVVVNGDAELVHVMEFGKGQCFVQQSGALQEDAVRDEVCRVMEGGREAFARRWKRLGGEG
jgi:energy-coupling factor transporter ATP-binding protein EcfA2